MNYTNPLAEAFGMAVPPVLKRGVVVSVTSGVVPMSPVMTLTDRHYMTQYTFGLKDGTAIVVNVDKIINPLENQLDYLGREVIYHTNGQLEVVSPGLEANETQDRPQTFEQVQELYDTIDKLRIELRELRGAHERAVAVADGNGEVIESLLNKLHLAEEVIAKQRQAIELRDKLLGVAKGAVEFMSDQHWQEGAADDIFSAHMFSQD